MIVNDPIADMLTRIRNAQIARHDATVMPASNTKKALAKSLLEEGYMKGTPITLRRKHKCLESVNFRLRYPLA